MREHGYLQIDDTFFERFVELEERMNKVRLAMLRWEVHGRAGTLEEEKRKQSEGGNFNITRAEMKQFEVDLGDHPRFEFEYMGFGDKVGLVQLDILLLALWNIVFFMVAYVSFLRYDIL